MRILLIGAGGQLGSEILRNNPGHEIIAPSREAFDLERIDQALGLAESVRPDMLVNCAAFHNVPLCENAGEQAFRVNCLSVRDLARACQRMRVRFVTFSSDYVFGGEKRTPYAEDDRPMPLQVYGLTRLAGEYAALWEAPDQAFVIRTCGLYGVRHTQSKGDNFVDKRVAEAASATTMEIASDQTVSPTSADDLSKALFQLLALSDAKPGVYHLVSEGQCTWYEFTRAIFDVLGLAVDLRPVDRGGRTGSMRRPAYSALANTRGRELGIVLAPWRDALARYLVRKHGALLAS